MEQKTIKRIQKEIIRLEENMKRCACGGIFEMDRGYFATEGEMWLQCKNKERIVRELWAKDLDEDKTVKMQEKIEDAHTTMMLEDDNFETYETLVKIETFKEILKWNKKT